MHTSEEIFNDILHVRESEKSGVTRILKSKLDFIFHSAFSEEKNSHKFQKDFYALAKKNFSKLNDVSRNFIKAHVREIFKISSFSSIFHHPFPIE
jgi:hypothetical protein